MSRRAPWACLVALLVTVGCSSPAVFGVDLTLQFDDSITNTQLASIKSLVFMGSGDEMYTHTTKLTRSLNRTEETVYKPEPATRSLTIVVQALDQNGVLIGEGDTGVLELIPGRAIGNEIVIKTPSLVDLSMPTDMTSVQDATKPVDIFVSRYRQAVLADQPLLYYRFDEASGVDAIDQSGHGNDGNYFGLFHLGEPGALSGDGDDDTSLGVTPEIAGTMTTAKSVMFAGLQPFTMEIWVRPVLDSGDPETYRHFINYDSSGISSPRQDWGMFIEPVGVIHFERYVNGVVVGIVSDAPLLTETWAYLVATFDGTKTQLYVNGVLQKDSKAATASMPTFTGGIVFFGASNDQGHAVNAFIDEAALYNVALAPKQISAHYAAAQ